VRRNRDRALELTIVAAVVMILGTACGGANPDIGLGAHFRASGAQFVEGELVNDQNADGPRVHSIASNNNHIYPGIQNKSVSGTVDNHGAAVAIGLAGDSGYWIVPVGGEDQMSPPDLSFSTRASFSPTLPAGTPDAPVAYTLIFRAVDTNGVMGPSSTQTLTLAAAPLAGAVVISLTWDNQADLDLHVVAPATAPLSGGPQTVEVWSKRRTTLATHGPADEPLTPENIAAAGILDFDSNSGCVYDGGDEESVVWAEQPPDGEYIVRVDASSLCGAPAARWHVRVFYGGQPVAGNEAYGQMGDLDTIGPHVAGAGLKVLDLTVKN
jgi:hypothetical protein